MGKVRETKGDTRRRKQKHNTIKYKQSAGTFHIILLNYFILTNKDLFIVVSYEDH